MRRIAPLLALSSVVVALAFAPGCRQVRQRPGTRPAPARPAQPQAVVARTPPSAPPTFTSPTPSARGGVPDLSGMTLLDATELAHRAGYEVVVLRVPGHPAGRVISQDVAPGSSVPAGTPVGLRVAAGGDAPGETAPPAASTLAEVDVPYVLDRTGPVARRILEEWGFAVREQVVATGVPGRVMDQRPAAGTRVARGAEVAIFVASPDAPPAIASTPPPSSPGDPGTMPPPPIEGPPVEAPPPPPSPATEPPPSSPPPPAATTPKAPDVGTPSSPSAPAPMTSLTVPADPSAPPYPTSAEPRQPAPALPPPAPGQPLPAPTEPPPAIPPSPPAEEPPQPAPAAPEAPPQAPAPSLPGLAVPTPTSPSSGATLPGLKLVTFTLSWTAVEGADGYVVEISESGPEGWQALLRKVVRSPTVTVELEPGTPDSADLRWRVRSTVGTRGGRASAWQTIHLRAGGR